MPRSRTRSQARGGKRSRKRRLVALQLRIARVDLLAPAGQSPARLPMTAVLITEPEPDPSGEPLHWLLLCSEGEATGDWAKRIKGWYEQRWVVEEYFRVLKTGTRIEDRRLDQADDLRKCLAFDAITAWRVFDLERAARDDPHRPADELMSAVEIKVLTAYLRAQGIVRRRTGCRTCRPSPLTWHVRSVSSRSGASPCPALKSSGKACRG